MRDNRRPPAVDQADATLLDALQAILRADAEAADVEGATGSYLGSITLDRIGREVP